MNVMKIFQKMSSFVADTLPALLSELRAQTLSSQSLNTTVVIRVAMQMIPRSEADKYKYVDQTKGTKHTICM